MVTTYCYSSQKLLESFAIQTCIADNLSHGDGVDGIMPRYRHDSIPVGHYYVLALPCDPKPGFLQRLDGA